MADLEVRLVPKDLYYHEVAYVDELRNSLIEMHACYMEAGSGEPLNKQQRHRHRMALIAARAVLEKGDRLK